MSISTFAIGQWIDNKWYSETTTDGVTIQNSYPKGGLYDGPVENKFNGSYLVFYTRVINGTDDPLAFTLNFSSDSIPIPNSSDTFVKLLLPSETKTLEKQNLPSYGITELQLSNRPTSFKRNLNPNEDCLFYVVASFYQTKAGEWSQQRGGNRAELISKGKDLFYSMPPQIASLRCGHITFK